MRKMISTVPSAKHRLIKLQNKRITTLVIRTFGAWNSGRDRFRMLAENILIHIGCAETHRHKSIHQIQSTS